MPARGLYLITPDELDTARLLARVVPVLDAGVACLQYRNKVADTATRRAQATALQQACAAAGVPLLVNDDVALAAAIGAAGVHLGDDELDLARRAVAAGASYVAFGAFFPTRSKVTTRRATPTLLGQAAALGVPRVAIGGITPANAGALVAAGADLVAVIGGVFDAPDPRAAVRAYAACFL